MEEADHGIRYSVIKKHYFGKVTLFGQWNIAARIKHGKRQE